jgi:two-component system response regulator HydG
MEEAPMSELGRRLLLVDDEESVRTSLSANLEVEGYEITEAANGTDAVELVRQQPFDLVLTDMRMPGMNGLEAFRAIREVRPGTVVLLMTGFANETMVGEALAEGAYAMLPKPVSIPHLLAVVARAVSRSLILVIGDRPQAQGLSQVLRNVGLNAEPVTDRSLALQRVAEKRVDQCVLDLTMAGADGVQLGEEIRKLDSSISLIAINGHQVPRAMHQMLRQGSYACLRQPLDTRELVHAIARAHRDYGRV